MRSFKTYIRPYRNGFRALTVFVLLVLAVFCFINFPTSASKPGLRSSANFDLASIDGDDKLQMSVINAALAEARLLDFHAPTRNLLISWDKPARLELFSAANHTELVSSGLFSRSGDPKSIAVARGKNSSFAPGEMFLGFDRGLIFRISTDASEISEIKLPQETAAVVGLVTGETNAFDGDLIAITDTGKIWRIEGSGNTELLATLGTSLRGVTIIPDNIERYGRLARKLLVGSAEQQGIYAVDAGGQIDFISLGVKVRDIDPVSPDEHLFAISTRSGKLFTASADKFAGREGSILVTAADSSAYYVVDWNGADFKTSAIDIGEEIDQTVFAPISLRDDAGGCVTSLQLPENVFEWEGGNGSFSVSAPVNCSWTATSNAPWLSLLSGQSGMGNGTVTYFVARNGRSTLREANVAVGTLTHRVRQSRKAQLQCILGFDPSSPTIPAIGGSGTINVTGNDECAWQAVSDSPWLTITSNPFGRGNGSINFTVATNFGAQSRTAAINFGRQNGGLPVTQDPNLAPLVNAGPNQTIALPNTAVLSGTATDDGVGNPVTVSWSKLSGPETVIFSGSNNLTNTAIFAKEGVYVLRLTASDGFLSASDDVQITVNPDPIPPPPDPSTTAPPINPTVATNPFDATKFLYTGPNAIQTGVAPGTIKEDRVAIFRGRVISKSASPIPKVKITILDHPELGQTLTRADGMFDIVVNGGGELNVRYEKLGFMPVQREERSDWQEYDSVEDVVMIPHDGNVTFIDLSSNTPIQVAQSGLITDTSGTRRSRLFFKQGTTATMRLPGGGTQPLTMMNVRSTEFTVGANGPETMPGDLPALSAYTYASGYTVDEAVALNATEVTFNQPVIQYNENFLNFPVGTNVPSGVFDEASGIWLPSANGRVVKILSITSGIANLDLNGSGNPATDPEYSALGINTAEREQLATLYAANQSLWRVPVIHFSSWDSNWPYGPPSGAEPPGGDPPQCDTCLDDDCEGAGCVIGFGNQTLGEEIKITGTPYFMRYSSERQKGRISNRSLTIALSGATVPASLKRIDLVVSVGGRVFEQSFPNQPNQITNFQWDGLDAYGRVMQGRQLAKIDIGYVYDGVYQNAGQFGYNGNGIPITGSTTRGEITLHQVHRSYVGNLDSRALGLGGWTLDAHHFYDPSERVLYEGNGTRRSVQTISNGINTFGGGVSGFDGDGGHVSQAQFRWPYGIGFTPDGTIYVADSGNSRIRKIATDGVVTTFAGNGGGCSPSNFPCGEGGLAINASIGNVNRVLGAPDGNVYIGGGRNLWRVTTDGIFRRVAGLALDGFSGDGGPARDAQISNATRFYPTPDGSVYLSDMLNQRIRRIDPNGIITTIAGNGTIGFSGDGGPATQAQLNFPGDIVAAPDGNVYFIDQDNNRIRRISPDGIISTYAGTGVFGVSPDGLDRLATHFVFRAANQIESGSMAIGPDGSLYVVSYANVTGGRVRRIKPDGIVEGIAGVNDQTAGFSGDGGPALQARMRLAAIGLAPDGVIYATGGFSFDFDESRIRRISSPLPNFNGTQIAIPSEDGRQLFQFDAQGRHLGTTDTLTNAPLFTFSYDSTGRLTTVVDGDNNTTTIERDGTGNPTGIRSPYDQLTTFTRDANGYLATITNPNNEAHQFTYSAGGLMLTERDPRNNLSTFTYNALGQLIRDDDPATGFQTLTRNDAGVNFTVTHDTSLNRQTAFQVNNLSNGDRQRINTLPDATQTSLLERGNGSDMLSDSDGTIINETTGGDPRWRLQAPITTNTTIATPGALNFNATFARAATLGTPGDPLSLISQTDTFNINGRTYTSVFTTSNRTFALTTPQNRQATRVIDTQGRLTQSQFADLNAGNYSYDTRGRLSIAAFGSGASARTYNLAYNPAGFLSSFTNPLNQTTNLTYDLAGRETQRTLPDGRNIAFGYDAKGNLTSLTPPGRPAHTFTYTPIDLVASYTAPNVGGNSTTTYAYNLDRQITSITRPDTLQITFGYNTAGRLQTLTVPTGSYGFAYNATTGLLSSITAPGGGVVAYQYDGFLSTRQTWTGTVAGNVSRTFDNNFRVASESINGANTVNFTYDNDNFLTGAGSLALTRNALNGLLTGSTLSNVNDTFTYNGFAEATNYNAKFNTTTLYDVNYTYDKLGRVTQKVETIGGTATTYAYGYDGTGRLTTVTLNGAPQPLVTYGYDTNNNRTSINVGGSVTTATYDAQDRLTQYGTTTYGYTLNGELQSKTAGGQTTQYSYDVLGNLRNVTLPDTTAIEYVIDGQDRRIGKRINGTLTQGFLYQDQLEPVAELDGSNNIVSRFVYGTRRNTPDYMIRGGVTYRIISDHIGSVRLVVDVATGNIAQRIDYDEFGVILNDTNPGFQPFGFAGGIYDTQTRLTRFGVRDYDAETGRWTAKDPIRFRGRNTNLYSYAFADPINFVDPDGAKPNSCPGGGPGGGPGGPNGPGGSGPGGPGGGGPSGGGSGGGSGGPGGGSGGSGGSGSGSGGGSGGNVINQTISGTLGLILSGLTNGGNASYGEPSTIPGDSNTLNQTYDPVPAPLPPGSSGGV